MQHGNLATMPSGGTGALRDRRGKVTDPRLVSRHLPCDLVGMASRSSELRRESAHA